MKSTDKYYEPSNEDFIQAQSRIMKALVVTSEKHNMCMEDISALAHVLAYRKASGDDNGMYEHCVDYLWMSYHIRINHKMLLLDLLDD